MKFLLPQGIGDSLWAMTKIQGIAQKYGDGRVEIAVTYGEDNEIERRSLPFLQAFSFVAGEVTAARAGNLLADQSQPTTEEGYYRYINQGVWEFHGERYLVLIPNWSLERGQRLETWFDPEIPVRWDLMRDFQIPQGHLWAARRQWQQIGPYAGLYACSVHANTINGHNRGPIWQPQQWAELADRLWQDFRIRPYFIGAPYDRQYFREHILPHIQLTTPVQQQWEWPITMTAAVLQHAQFVIAYQSGLGVLSSYLGVPTAMWWRPKGDSICPAFYLSPEEQMATAWVDPKTLELGRYRPLIYGRETVEDIITMLADARWDAQTNTEVEA